MNAPQENAKRMLELLIKNKDHPLLDQWEKNFIRDISSKKQNKITLRDRIVINRLSGWLKLVD